MKFMIHFFVLGSKSVFNIFCDSVNRGTVSKALFMSIVAMSVRDGGGA